jgi:hypothetical protein
MAHGHPLLALLLQLTPSILAGLVKNPTRTGRAPEVDKLRIVNLCARTFHLFWS